MSADRPPAKPRLRLRPADDKLVYVEVRWPTWGRAPHGKRWEYVAVGAIHGDRLGKLLDLLDVLDDGPEEVEV